MPFKVSPRALVQRINRQLRHDLCAVRKVRGDIQVKVALGDYYVVDFVRNIPAETHVDLEDLGRRLGVLKPLERVAA